MPRSLVLLIALLLSAHAYAAEAPKQPLTELQRYVTQGGTEKPFQNEYWDNHEDGIYVDIISGEPLFSSTDKYDSGTGWPSFTKPIDKTLVQMKSDTTLGTTRTEVQSKSGTHLGHIFDDGPKDKGGKRYCINSASLRFISKANLEKEGYGKFLPLFGLPASAAAAAPAVLPAPKIIVLYFYADWCPICKNLGPKITEARTKGDLDSKDVLFVTLNLTDKATIHQSTLLASALGVDSFVKQQGSGTGYIALLNAKTKQELNRLLGNASPEAIRQAVTQALDADK